MDKKNSIEVDDGFIVCPRCGSHLCYAQRIPSGDETWMCMSCGFTSTNLMKEGSETEQQVTQSQPKLYLDLKFVDPDGYVWYPAVITVPDAGMVFLDGTSLENYEWVGVPLRPLTKKEQRMKQNKDKTFMMETAKTKHFGKDGFTNAVSEMGIW